MADDNQNPIAQGTDTSTDSTGNGVPAGVQARFDELTAKLHASERQAQEREAQINALINAQIAQTQSAPQGQTQAAIEMEPEEQKKFDYVLAQKMAPMEKLLNQLQQTLVSQQVQQVASQLPPEVQKRAAELRLSWMREGKQGWNEHDAARYALGEFYERQAVQGNANAQRQNFNALSHNVSAQAMGAPSAVAPSAIPKNIDSLPIEQQIAIYEKAGVGDLPL